MHAEEAIQVERRSLSGSGAGDGDGRSCGVVLPLAIRHDHVQAVDCAALENGNQGFASSTGKTLSSLSYHGTLQK